MRASLVGLMIVGAAWACSSEDDGDPKSEAEGGDSGSGESIGGGGAASVAGAPVVGGNAGVPACGDDCAELGGAAGAGGVNDPCSRPRGSSWPTLKEVECDALCVPGDPNRSYRVDNDCGGFNLVRQIDGQEQTWSFDSTKTLVGVRESGGDDAAPECDSLSYGSPCGQLESYSQRLKVCKLNPLDDDGTGGEGGQGAQDYSSVAKAEQCGVDCGHRDLATLCSAHFSECPTFVGGHYAGIAERCGDGLGSVTYVPSDCGGYIITSDSGAGVRSAWHFDGEDALIGAESLSVPRELGTYCAEASYGDLCAPQGAAISLCPESGGGCQVPFVPDPTLTPSTVDDRCGIMETTYEWDNDCGGVNVRQGVLEHGFHRLLSFDDEGTYVGDFYQDDDVGYELRECEGGGLGFGQLSGKVCKSVGSRRDRCP